MGTSVQQVIPVQHKVQLTFEELGIEAAALEDYIGFQPGSAPEPFPQLIDEIFSECRILSAQGGYSIYNGVQIDRTRKCMLVGDLEFQTEAIVTKKLDRSKAVAVFACTAGNEISRLASEFNRKGHSIHAYLIDSVGSIVVERAMDLIQEKLKSAMQSDGLLITNRYSPGYCGWDIREQKKLFELLPPDFCGIRLTETMLMKPVKSVSGFIGIGREVKYDSYTCGYCDDKSCIYRNKR